MRLRLIAVGSRMPRWVEEGWQEYVKRLPAELSLELVEIPLNTRGKNADVARLIRQEGEAMLARVQPGERVVTLEVEGRPWSTEQLARELDRWRLDARTVNLLTLTHIRSCPRIKRSAALRGPYTLKKNKRSYT